MSKITINYKVKSNSTNEILKNKKAILKDNTITYSYNNILTNIKIGSNRVYITRYNDDIKICLEFSKGESIATNYAIKDLKVNINLETRTNELIISDNSILIKYDLFMNNEYSDSFEYELEWSDLQ